MASCPAYIRNRPGVVIRSRPAMSAIWPIAINRALCETGIVGAKPCTGVLPAASREANSSSVSVGSDPMARAWTNLAIPHGQFCPDLEIKGHLSWLPLASVQANKTPPE